jgi:hypothetical protein
MVHKLNECADHVPDIAETTRLLTIAIHCDGAAGQSLFHKSRYHHTVTAGLPWTNGIEQADYYRRQLFLAPISEGQKLINSF